MSQKVEFYVGWHSLVNDFAISGGWTFDGNALVICDALGGVYVYEGDSGKQIWSKINAHGNVKIIREELSVIGDKARYDPIQNKLFVFGEVEVLQNQSTILCDKIIVDLENSSSIMSSDSNKRVEALIINEK